MSVKIHEVDLDTYTIEVLRSVGRAWVYLPISYRASVGDVVIVYAGAKTGEFLHPSVFAGEIINVDSFLQQANMNDKDLTDRVLVRFVKHLAAIAL